MEIAYKLTVIALLSIIAVLLLNIHDKAYYTLDVQRDILIETRETNDQLTALRYNR